MSDLFDVERLLVSTLAAGLFSSPYVPKTLANSTVSVNGSPVPVRLSRGWPVSDALDADLANGVTTVTVWPEGGMSRDVPRRFNDWQVSDKVPLTVSTSVSFNTVTITGSGTSGQVVGVGYDASGYALRLGGSANASTIATNLAALVPGATANGATITLATTSDVYANVVSDRNAWLEIARQAQVFRLSIWAPSPKIRDAIGSTIAGIMAGVRAMPLPDGAWAERPKYRGVWLDDKTEKAAMWLRYARYEVEYPITETKTEASVLFTGLKTFDVLEGHFWPTAAPIDIGTVLDVVPAPYVVPTLRDIETFDKTSPDDQ